MSKDVVETILETCRDIKNRRDILSVLNHLKGEVKELNDEAIKAVYGNPAGEDGLLGESVDVMLCAVDMMYMNNPNVTQEQIMEVVVKKLAKWKRIYG